MNNEYNQIHYIKLNVLLSFSFKMKMSLYLQWEREREHGLKWQPFLVFFSCIPGTRESGHTYMMSDNTTVKGYPSSTRSQNLSVLPCRTVLRAEMYQFWLTCFSVKTLTILYSFCHFAFWINLVKLKPWYPCSIRTLSFVYCSQMNRIHYFPHSRD